MDKDELQEKIKESLDTYFASVEDAKDIIESSDHIASLAIDAIWDDIEEALDDQAGIFTNDD